jgi:hypothetical protein
MKTEIIKVDAKETAKKIAASLAGGISQAVAAYKEYVAGGGDPMELRQHCALSAAAWRIIDDIACDRIDMRVMLLPATAQRCIAMLPRVTQTEVIDSGLELLTDDGSTIRVRPSELTGDQSRQLFGPSGVRSSSEQAAWLKGFKRNAVAPLIEHAYEVKHGRLSVFRASSFTVSDLHRILAEME